MAPGRVSRAIQAAKAISKRLIFAYALDWITLVILALVAYGFTLIDPHFRAFSLVDLSISFPYRKESVSVPVLAASCVLAPAVIIAGVVVLLVPGPAAWKRMSGGEIFRIKIWELNVGLLGLALAHATQFLLVQGMKNIIGKPRPDMLERCQPDLTNVDQYRVGGFGQDISPRWVLVTIKICMQQNRSLLVDGFRSFPSGHNSTAFAGMLYLSLYLASKFGIGFPVLPFHKRKVAGENVEGKAKQTRDSSGFAPQSTTPKHRDYRQFGYRDEAAAAPIWTLFLVYVPIGVAIYIGGTRYFEYYHQGFDVLAGSVIGLLSGWIGFRWYHGPLGRCAGWAWSPRSRDRAFGIGVGTLGYVTNSHHSAEELAPQDVELGVLGSSGQAQTRPPWQRDRYESLGSMDSRRGGTREGAHMR